MSLYLVKCYKKLYLEVDCSEQRGWFEPAASGNTIKNQESRNLSYHNCELSHILVVRQCIKRCWSASMPVFCQNGEEWWKNYRYLGTSEFIVNMNSQYLKIPRPSTKKAQKLPWLFIYSLSNYLESSNVVSDIMNEKVMHFIPNRACCVLLCL